MQPSRILFVTVGTTALSARKLGQRLVDRQSAKAWQERCSRFLSECATASVHERGLMDERGEQLFDDIVDLHTRYWEQPLRNTADGDDERTAAELTSTWLLVASRFGKDSDAIDETFEGRLHPSRDQVILLASDTTEGLLSARILERVLRLPFLWEDAKIPGDNSVRIAKLEGISARDFKPAIEQIKTVGDPVIDQAGDQDMRLAFNVTGGYKGLIPAIVRFARNSSLREYRPKLFYQYVSQKDVVELELFGEQRETRLPGDRDTLGRW